MRTRFFPNLWRSSHAKLRRLSQSTEVRSRPSGSAPLPVQANRGLPGLLHRDLLSPRAHERGGPRINYPTVPRGTERLRLTPTPLHSDEQIDRLVTALTEIWSRSSVDPRRAGRAPASHERGSR